MLTTVTGLPEASRLRVAAFWRDGLDVFIQQDAYLYFHGNKKATSQSNALSSKLLFLEKLKLCNILSPSPVVELYPESFEQKISRYSCVIEAVEFKKEELSWTIKAKNLYL